MLPSNRLPDSRNKIISLSQCNAANGYRGCLNTSGSDKNDLSLATYDRFNRLQEYNVYLPMAARLIEEYLGPGRLQDIRMKNPMDIITSFAEILEDFIEKQGYGTLFNNLTGYSPVSLNEVATFIAKYGDALIKFFKNNPTSLKTVMQQMLLPLDEIITIPNNESFSLGPASRLRNSLNSGNYIITNNAEKKIYNLQPDSIDILESRADFVQLGYKLGSLFKLGPAYAHIFLGIADEILMPARALADFMKKIEDRLNNVEDAKKLQELLSPNIVTTSEIKATLENLMDVGIIVSRINYHKALLALFSSVILTPLNLNQQFEAIMKNQLLAIKKFYLIRLTLGYLFTGIRNYRLLLKPPPNTNGPNPPSEGNNEYAFQLLQPILKNIHSVGNELLLNSCLIMNTDTNSCQKTIEIIFEACDIEKLDFLLMLIGKLLRLINDRVNEKMFCTVIGPAFEEFSKRISSNRLDVNFFNTLYPRCNNRLKLINPIKDREKPRTWEYLCNLARNKLFLMCFEALETSKGTTRCVNFVERWGEQCFSEAFDEPEKKSLVNSVLSHQLDESICPRIIPATKLIDRNSTEIQTYESLNQILRACLVRQTDETNNANFSNNTSAVSYLCQLVHAKISIFCASLRLGNSCALMADTIKKYCLFKSTDEATNFLNMTSSWVDKLPLSNVNCNHVDSDLTDIWQSLDITENDGDLDTIQEFCHKAVRSTKTNEAVDIQNIPDSPDILCTNVRGRLSNVCLHSLDLKDCLNTVDKIYQTCKDKPDQSQITSLYGPPEIDPSCENINDVVSDILSEEDNDTSWNYDALNLGDACLRADSSPVEFLQHRERLCRMVQAQSSFICRNFNLKNNCANVANEIKDICLEFSDTSFWRNLLHLIGNSENKMELIPLACLMFFGTINRLIHSAEKSFPIVDQIIQECFNRSIS